MSMKRIISGAVTALGLILAGQVASAAPVSPVGNIEAAARALTAVKLAVRPGHAPGGVGGPGGGGGLSIRPPMNSQPVFKQLRPQMSFGPHPKGGRYLHHGKLGHMYPAQRYIFGATIGLGLYGAESCYWDCVGLGYKDGYCRSHYFNFCH